MFSFKLTTEMIDSSSSHNERNALKNMINESVNKAEEQTLDELNRQTFCTIEVKHVTWGRKPALIVLIDDVTDQTQTQFLQTWSQEKEQQQRDAENFKATASHELRTPIKMCIYLLHNLLTSFKDVLDQEKYKSVQKMLEMILSQMFLMECFVEDLLSYNMIQSGAFNLKPVDFNPLKVLEFIKQTFQGKFEQKNLRLTVKFVSGSAREDKETSQDQMRLIKISGSRQESNILQCDSFLDLSEIEDGHPESNSRDVWKSDKDGASLGNDN